jgi:hypothetical protein
MGMMTSPILSDFAPEKCRQRAVAAAKNFSLTTIAARRTLEGDYLFLGLLSHE